MKRSLLTLLLLAIGFQPALASPSAEQGLRLLLGEPLVDHDPLAGQTDSSAPSSLSLRFSQPLGTFTNFFGNLNIASMGDKSIRGLAEGSLTAIQGGIEWFFAQPQKMQWFMLGGMGGMHVDHDNKPDVTQPTISFGVGQNWAIGANDALRWELRANQTLGNENLPNWTPINFQAIFSYQWGK